MSDKPTGTTSDPPPHGSPEIFDGHLANHGADEPPGLTDGQSALSAPAEIRYCAKCATEMSIREIGGKPRKACPKCRYIHFMEPRVGVGVLVIDDGALLLVQRRMDPHQGSWCIPAGFLDYGEDPKVTAVREVLEETNLHVRLIGLVDVFYNPPGEGASVFVLYRGEQVSGVLQAGDDANAAGFFKADELPPLAFESTAAAVRELVKTAAS